MSRIALVGLLVVVAVLIVDSAGRAQSATPTPTSTPRATATAALMPETASPTEAAKSDEDRFADLREEALKRPLVYGPADGSLALDQQKTSVAAADVTVRDFAVHVTFTNPTAAGEHAWDYGLIFRLSSAGSFQLVVDSTGTWYLAVDTAQPDQTGSVPTLNRSANGTNSLDLIAIGDDGYLGVNGSYVATLDLSAHTEAGQVAVAAPFFSESSLAGGTTAYTDFIIWSFDEVSGSPVASTAPAATATPPATVTPPGTAEASPATANSYTSPTYGYTLVWDDNWQELEQSSQDQVDYLRIASNAALIELVGLPWTGTADDCIDSLVDYYQRQTGYSNVKIAVDDAGKDQRGDKGGTAWAVIAFTLTSNGQADDYADYVECRPIVSGESILSMEYVTFAADYDAQADEHARMFAALTLPGAEGATGTPEATAASPEVTVGSALGPVGVSLAAENGSGASGLATLSETEDGGQTVVKVLVVGAPAGAVGLIHVGTCDNLDPSPAFLLSPFDENGASATTIKATLRDLRVMGEYAIAIYASAGDLSQPIACGEIPTAG